MPDPVGSAVFLSRKKNHDRVMSARFSKRTTGSATVAEGKPAEAAYLQALDARQKRRGCARET